MSVQFGLSSLRIFKPGISLPTWMGRRRPDRRVPIYNFFNRVKPPREGRTYSTRVTYARDYLGGQHTYDGHLGTDFACPIGTPIVAAAPGVVLRVGRDMSMGGLKVCVDHGEGLFTTSNHLSRALVSEGARVERGQTIGLSGASGWEFILFFPWVSPHLHFNVWLNGEPVDPFAREGEIALWRRHNDPVPFSGERVEESFAPTAWDSRAVDEAIAACVSAAERERLSRVENLPKRAAEVLILSNYRPALFSAFPQLYGKTFQRRPRLDLPFRREDFIGIALDRSPGSAQPPHSSGR
jgi:murein DD-endopeptidase